jgi:hypothetical protein
MMGCLSCCFNGVLFFLLFVLLVCLLTNLSLANLLFRFSIDLLSLLSVIELTSYSFCYLGYCPANMPVSSEKIIWLVVFITNFLICRLIDSHTLRVLHEMIYYLTNQLAGMLCVGLCSVVLLPYLVIDLLLSQLIAASTDVHSVSRCETVAPQSLIKANVLNTSFQPSVGI